MRSEEQASREYQTAISAHGITKTYRLFNHSGDRIKQFFSFGLKQYYRRFTALQDITFDIQKGETLGIIGRNGSGKSTLLQICCGILSPTAGIVTTSGRISALLELGAGFNPEFTGRENVYFQGAITGLPRDEIDARFEQIACFAGIGEYIDEPVRTYSSGMFVRLAFATAINCDPDTLIVDEALGVGDAEFQERCFSHMKKMQKNGTTILFVSHSIPTIRNFCERAIWLDKGKIIKIGNAGEICQAYQSNLERNTIESREETFFNTGSRKHPSGSIKKISIFDFKLSDSLIKVGAPLAFQFTLDFSNEFKETSEFGIGIIIRNEYGRLVTVFNTVRDDIQLIGTVRKVTLKISHTAFVPGRYWVSVNVCDRDVLYAYDELDRCANFEVIDARNRQGIPRWEGEVACEHAWHF